MAAKMQPRRSVLEDKVENISTATMTIPLVLWRVTRH
jgi:hypothetical protein